MSRLLNWKLSWELSLILTLYRSRIFSYISLPASYMDYPYMRFSFKLNTSPKPDKCKVPSVLYEWGRISHWLRETTPQRPNSEHWESISVILGKLSLYLKLSYPINFIQIDSYYCPLIHFLASLSCCINKSPQVNWISIKCFWCWISNKEERKKKMEILIELSFTMPLASW